MSAPAPPLALPARLLGLVFLPFAAGFFLSFMFRNVNAVISKDLAAEFALSASELGLLTSAYFLAFAAMQIPVGVFLDRYGPRRVTASLLTVLALGAAAFGAAEGPASLAIGRALIGVGASAALMGAMKAYSMWFPLERLATLYGWTVAIGALGAVSATLPVEYAASLIGWRTMFIGLAVIAFAVAACMFLVVPEKPVPGASERWDEQLSKVASIFRTPVFWRLGLPMILIQGSYQGMFGLWFVPWLMDTQGLPRSEAAQWLLWAAIAYGCGSIFFGPGADRMAERGVPQVTLLTWGTGFCVVSFFLLGFVPGVPKFALLLCYAFGACATSLSYAMLSRRFPLGMTGRLNTALNVSTFVWAFAVQMGAGVLLRLFPAEGGRYPVEAYALVLAILGAAQLGSWIFLSAMKEEKTAVRTS